MSLLYGLDRVQHIRVFSCVFFNKRSVGGTGGADGDGMNLILYVSSLCGCRLQVFLNTYGIQTQTPQQVEPIQIWPQKELVKVKLVGHMSVRAF